MKELLGRLVRGLGDCGGAAALEFVLVAPCLCLLLLGLVDLGLGFQAQMSVSQAAQAGSYDALIYGYNTSTIAQAVTGATGLNGISATPAPSESCGCPTGTGISASSCNSTCASGQAPGTYVTVNATYQYATILSYPVLSNPMTLAASSTVRIQ